MERQVAFSVDDISLQGLLSETQSVTGAVVCHPHPLRGGNMDNNVVSAIVRDLQRANFATLRFNFRGVGNSLGVHDDGNGERDDVRAAVGFLVEQNGCSDVALVGYSFGALVGLQAGIDDPRVRSMAAIGLPVMSRDISFLQNIEKPTLLVSGDLDHVSPVSRLAESVGTHHRHVTVVSVRGADHFFFGGEDVLTRQVTAFLLNHSNSISD